MAVAFMDKATLEEFKDFFDSVAHTDTPVTDTITAIRFKALAFAPNEMVMLRRAKKEIEITNCWRVIHYT